MKQLALVMLVAVAMSLVVACGGNDDGAPSDATGTPLATVSPEATAVERPPAGPARYCLMGGEALPAQNVQITARWKGKDRIVIEGSANLPGPGSVTYWICQDGELTSSLQWTKNPTFENGKISAESKLIESATGPLFDPDASFTVVISVLGEPIQVPYFTVAVPVEGKPD